MTDAPPDDDWEALLPRLLLWAERLHARALGGIRGAPSPADLVQDAVTDVLTGRRTRPDDLPLATVLYGVMRSRVSQELSRGRTRGEARGPRYVSLEDARPVHTRDGDPAADADLRARTLALVAGDETLERMVALWFEDPGLKPGDLADMLGLSAAEVYAAARRLRRADVRRADLGLDETAFAALRLPALRPWAPPAGARARLA